MQHSIPLKRFINDFLTEKRNVLTYFLTEKRKFYKNAFKVWNDRRLDLLECAKHSLEYSKEDAIKNLKKGKWDNEDKPFSQETIDNYKNTAENGDDMYLRIIENLSCEDPEKIDNYPHETPYIQEIDLEE